VAVYGAGGQCYYANPAALFLLGRSVPEALNADRLGQEGNIVVKGTAQSYEPGELPLTKALAGVDDQTANVQLRIGGERRDLEMMAAPLQSGEATEGAVMVVRDAKEQQQAETPMEGLRKHLHNVIYALESKSSPPYQAPKAPRDSAGDDLQGLKERLKGAEERLRMMAQHKDELERKNAELWNIAFGNRAGDLSRLNPHNEKRRRQMIAKEKMASIGQSVAGIAHEVNTPISAVKAGVSNMIKSLPAGLRQLVEILNDLPAEVRQSFLRLLERSVQPRHVTTTREERQHRKAIQGKLEEAGVEDALAKAKGLVEVQVLSGLDELLPLMRHERATEMLAVAARFGALKKNMDNVDVASDAIIKIVGAIKSFSYVQYEQKFIPTRLQDNIEVVLTVFYNALKYGVGVGRNYQEVPPVPVLPDEIMQVWTNIINNAVDAMEGKGNLVIDLEQETDEAIVRITDDGPGIPEDHLPAIWEPFFTTKSQGEGSGLGLSISKQIVAKHGGRIEVESQPNRTSFIVRLPLTQPKERVAAKAFDDEATTPAAE
jgi:signal transduction histidine kinase